MPTVFTADDCPLAISVLGTRIVKLVDPASIVLRIVTLTTNLLYINQDAAGLVKIFIKDGEPKERFSRYFFRDCCYRFS